MDNILKEYQTIPDITKLLNGLFGLQKIERDAVMQVEWIQWLGITKKSQEMQDVQQAPDIAAFNPCHLIAHGAAGCCPQNTWEFFQQLPPNSWEDCYILLLPVVRCGKCKCYSRNRQLLAPFIWRSRFENLCWGRWGCQVWFQGSRISFSRSRTVGSSTLDCWVAKCRKNYKKRFWRR